MRSNLTVAASHLKASSWHRALATAARAALMLGVALNSSACIGFGRAGGCEAHVSGPSDPRVHMTLLFVVGFLVLSAGLASVRNTGRGFLVLGVVLLLAA